MTVISSRFFIISYLYFPVFFSYNISIISLETTVSDVQQHLYGNIKPSCRFQTIFIKGLFIETGCSEKCSVVQQYSTKQSHFNVGIVLFSFHDTNLLINTRYNSRDVGIFILEHNERTQRFLSSSIRYRCSACNDTGSNISRSRRRQRYDCWRSTHPACTPQTLAPASGAAHSRAARPPG